MIGCLNNDGIHFPRHVTHQLQLLTQFVFATLEFFVLGIGQTIGRAFLDALFQSECETKDEAYGIGIANGSRTYRQVLL